LNLPPDITWVSVVTDVSEIFVLPFRVLWFQIPSVDALPLANVEVYTLIAILIYGVLSRLLVGILKGILKSR
jgi:riboflavin transporter FmnP